MPQATAIDLFCGCGGLTQGLKDAGCRVLAGVDIDGLSVETYRLNHPEVHVWQHDIRLLSPSEVMAALGIEPGQLGLLVGCPPCQGFSSIRTLNGARIIEDPRNELVFDFLRYVRGLRPRALMLENVPGLNNDRRADLLCEALEELDYRPRRRVLNAADHGVPQRRRRMVLLAGHTGSIPFAPPSTHRRTVRDAIGGLPPPGTGSDPLQDYPEKRSARIMELIAAIPHDGGSRTDLGPEYQLPCHRRAPGFNDVYGRMAWDEVAPTITGGCVNPSKGRFLHPDQDRAITLREAALLQTFPPDYEFSLRRGKYAVAALIGNAFPPEFARRHAAEIVQYLSSSQGAADATDLG